MFRQKKSYNKTPSRRRVPGVGAQTQLTRRTPIAVVSATVVTGHKLSVTFDQAVILKGIPNWLDAGSHLPLSAVQVSPTLVQAIYLADPVGPVVAAFEDPAIRNAAAGYLRDSVVMAAA